MATIWPKTKKEQPKSYLDQLPHAFVFSFFLVYIVTKKNKKKKTSMGELV